MSGYKPGPWNVEYTGLAEYFFDAAEIKTVDGDLLVAIAPSDSISNIKLIATAPEMYEVIKYVRRALMVSTTVNTSNPDDLLGQSLLKCLDIECKVEGES